MADGLFYLYAGALAFGILFSLFQLFNRGLRSAAKAIQLNDADVGVSLLSLAWSAIGFGAVGLLLGGLIEMDTRLSFGLALIGGLMIGGIAQIVFLALLNQGYEDRRSLRDYGED